MIPATKQLYSLTSSPWRYEVARDLQKIEHNIQPSLRKYLRDQNAVPPDPFDTEILPVCHIGNLGK